MVSSVSVCFMDYISLFLQPRSDLRHPARGVFTQAGAAEMDAFAAAVTQFAFEHIAVRACEREAILPQRILRRANVRRGFVMVKSSCTIHQLSVRNGDAGKPSRL